MMIGFPGAGPSATTAEKQVENNHAAANNNNKTPNSSVSYIYVAKLVEFRRNVTVTWGKINLINYSLTIDVESPSDESQCYSCKIDIKTKQFWGKKGLKSFEVEGRRLDVYWDFRKAKFSTIPEPSSDYYVAIVQDDEVALVLGDMKTDAYKRTKKQPSKEDPTLLCKKENVYGKKLFCTKSILQHGKSEQDIVVEISSLGMGDPEMWISVDGFEVIHVMNLNWRFRGNENVAVDDTSIQIFWDVHDWLFSSSGTSHGLFVLKPGAKDCTSDDAVQDGNHNSEMQDCPTSEFIHVIDAWKFE